MNSISHMITGWKDLWITPSPETSIFYDLPLICSILHMISLFSLFFNFRPPWNFSPLPKKIDVFVPKMYIISGVSSTYLYMSHWFEAYNTNEGFQIGTLKGLWISMKV